MIDSILINVKVLTSTPNVEHKLGVVVIGV